MNDPSLSESMLKRSNGRRSAQARQEHREFRVLLGLAKKLSKEIEERVVGSSINVDELNHKLDLLSDIESNLFMEKRFKYLSVTDMLALLKYYDNVPKRVLEFFERI